jgi:hypothetical protein
MCLPREGMPERKNGGLTSLLRWDKKSHFPKEMHRHMKWLIGCFQRGPCLQDDTLGLDYAEGQPGELNSVIAEIEKV